MPALEWTCVVGNEIVLTMLSEDTFLLVLIILVAQFSTITIMATLSQHPAMIELQVYNVGGLTYNNPIAILWPDVRLYSFE